MIASHLPPVIAGLAIVCLIGALIVLGLLVVLMIRDQG